MKTIEIGGTTVKIEVRTGVVLAAEKHTLPRGGKTPRSLSEHEFWIQDEGGQELPFTLIGTTLLLRPGQDVSIVGVRAGSSSDFYVAAVVNHNAGSITRAASDGELAKHLGLTPSLHGKEFAVLGLGIAIPWFLISDHFAVLGGGLLLAAFGASRWIKERKAYPGRLADLSHSVGEVARDELRNRPARAA